MMDIIVREQRVLVGNYCTVAFGDFFHVNPTVVVMESGISGSLRITTSKDLKSGKRSIPGKRIPDSKSF